MLKKSTKCMKCKEEDSVHSFIVKGGTAYNLCKDCSEKFDNIMQTGADIVNNFIETKVDKNMREARERRARGERLWP